MGNRFVFSITFILCLLLCTCLCPFEVVVPILPFLYGLQFNVSFLFMMEGLVGLVECFHLVFSL